jgi:hypothetical protein
MLDKLTKINKNIYRRVQVCFITVALGCFALNSYALPLYEEPVFFQAQTSLTSQESNQLKKIALRVAVASVHAVHLDLALLKTPRPGHGQPVGFNVEDTLLLPISFDSKTKKGVGKYIWRGSIRNDQSSQVTLVVNKQRVTGMITQGNNIYTIEPLGKGLNHALIRVDQSQFPPEGKTKAQATSLNSMDIFGGERNLFHNQSASHIKALSSINNETLNTIQARPATSGVQVVQIALPLLSASADVNPFINVNVAPGTTLPVVLTSQQPDSAANLISRGVVLNDANSQVTFVMNGSNVTGMIRTKTDSYAIEPLGNGDYALVHINSSKYPADHPANSIYGISGLPTMIDTVVPSTQATDTIIDVLVVYTSSAKTASGNIKALVSLAVDEANQSYENSLIPIKLNLVYQYSVPYTESGSFNTDLKNFSTANDGVLGSVQAKRNLYNADVAVLLINNDSACGLAGDIMANRGTAFAVVHYDCATGNYSFAHEIGHLQGARHDTLQDSNNGPSCSTFNHGYVNAAQGWRTIMAYNNASCVNGFCKRVQYWSNPSITYNGSPTGIAGQNNNAKCLKQTRSKVAGFR